MHRTLFTVATAMLLSTTAPAAIMFTYTSTSPDPRETFSFTLPTNFTPATFNSTSFTTGPVTVSSNTTFGPITYADNFRFYTTGGGGGFDSGFNVYFGPTVFTGPTSAPMFVNKSYAMNDGNYDGTLVISGAPTTPGGGSNVPEPATWAMMVAGFGAIGGAMRARRRVTIAFA